MVRSVICVALALATSGAASGCGDRRIAALERVRDRVCACKTASCADEAMKGVPDQDLPSNPRSQKVARAMLDCLAKVYDAGRPTTDPDSPQAP